jgi:hypothetical protein
MTGKWHELETPLAALTHCGLRVNVHDAVTADEANDEIGRNRTSVCGTCGRVKASTVRWARGLASSRKPLDDEQLRVARSLEQEARRRKRLQKAAKWDRSGSRSSRKGPRTVSGGLPGLGKKRG